MNINELKAIIDDRFEMYYDKKISLEDLRSFVRMAVEEFASEIYYSLGKIREGLDKL